MTFAALTGSSNRKNNAAKTILVVGTTPGCELLGLTLDLYKDFQSRGAATTVVATGYEGVKRTGAGVVVASMTGFTITGMIEREIESAQKQGAEFILVEGQGSITHQGSSNIALGVMHGVLPDAMILCHSPFNNAPDLERVINLYEDLIGLFHPTKILGICMKSAGHSDEQSLAEEKRIELETGLPVVDSSRYGVKRLTDALFEHFGFTGVSNSGTFREQSISARGAAIESMPFG